jgi:hypothetical protein
VLHCVENLRDEEEFGWGNWRLRPDEMWQLTEAEDWHGRFHEQENKRPNLPKLYEDTIDLLAEVPVKTTENAKSKVYKFLRVWGTMRWIDKSECNQMLERLNEWVDLLKVLRRESRIDADLSKEVSYDQYVRPVGRWMQFLVDRISRTSQSKQIVASTKLLHAAIPNLFVMFDRKMSLRFFGKDPSLAIYCGLFLPLAQAEMRLLCEHGLHPDPKEVCGRRGECWPKLIDEINWTWANAEGF